MQLPPRLLLAGAVLTALTASGGTVLTLATSTLPDPVPASAPAAPAPAPEAPEPPQDADEDSAAEPGGSAPAAPAKPRPAGPDRHGTDGVTPTAPSPDRNGMSEQDWERLPPDLREKVRLACKEGYLSGPHCAHA